MYSRPMCICPSSTEVGVLASGNPQQLYCFW